MALKMVTASVIISPVVPLDNNILAALDKVVFCLIQCDLKMV